MQSKHAYCIMAHGNWSLLQKLVSLLDDERNDLYIHIDTKSYRSYMKWGEVKVTKSKLEIISQLDVRWSDISLAEQEILLFNEVIKSGEKYERVHLLSGQDLPLKSVDETHQFFDEHSKEEFIESKAAPQFKKRLQYYHLFVRQRRIHPLYEFLRRVFLVFQMILRVNRLKSCNLPFLYGSEWVSLTYDAVKYIVSQFPRYRNFFNYTTACDESYKQMILSKEKGRFTFSPLGNLRYIIFKNNNPSPETLTMPDFDYMMRSGAMFARKFDDVKSPEVVEKLMKYIQGSTE